MMEDKAVQCGGCDNKYTLASAEAWMIFTGDKRERVFFDSHDCYYAWQASGEPKGRAVDARKFWERGAIG